MNAEPIDTTALKEIGSLTGQIAKEIIDAMERDSCIAYTIIDGTVPIVKVWADRK
jgi:hypothetical protein